MIKYDNYKDSGIDWLGEIPEHWNIIRVKDLFKTQSGTTPLSGNLRYYNGNINWIRTTDLNNDLLFETEYKITELALNECNLKFIPVNSILIAMYGGFGTIGKHSLLKRTSTINQSVCAVLPNPKKYSSDFLYYFFKYFRNDWKLFADGTRKDPNINQEAIKSLPIYFAPLFEQKTIVKYLNSKIQAIDKKTTLLHQKINYYKELRKSIIKNTIAKGLNNIVEMKDSGIDWIGQIPKHWNIVRGKDIFCEYAKSKIPASEGKEEGKYKFFTSSNEQSKFLDSFQMNQESILFSTGGSAGVNYCEKEYSYSTDCWAIFGNKKILLKYYSYYFESILHEIQQKGFKGSSLEHLQKDFITLSEIIFPPKLEQITISNYLDEKTNQIDAIVNNIKQQIEKLKELRKTLINDVVTGKIKVTTIQ